MRQCWARGTDESMSGDGSATWANGGGHRAGQQVLLGHFQPRSCSWSGTPGWDQKITTLGPHQPLCKTQTLGFNIHVGSLTSPISWELVENWPCPECVLRVNVMIPPRAPSHQKELSFAAQHIFVGIYTLPLFSCVTLDQYPNLSEP